MTVVRRTIVRTIGLIILACSFMNKILKPMIFLIVLIMMPTTITACAKENDHAKLIINLGFDNVMLRNAEGKYLKFIEPAEDYEDSEMKGDMEVFKDDLYTEDEEDGEDSPDRWLLEIPDSDRFSVESLDEIGIIGWQLFFEMRNKYNESAFVFAEYVQKIEIDKSALIITGDKGSTFDYRVSQLCSVDAKEKGYYNVSGKTIGAIRFDKADKGCVLTGAKGKSKISIASLKDGDDLGSGTYYFYGQKVKIYKKKGKLIVSPSVKIPERKTKNVTCVYLRPSNGGNNMFLSWNKVKKAKSYIVYKYDYINEKYKKVAVRNGENYLNIKEAEPSEKYMYKIVAKSKAKGKGKMVCKTSYPVWAVAQDNAYSNVTKATTNRTTIKGKPGKKIRVKATVEGKADKRLLSKNIRWYSSNRKIAKVGRDTGKVTLMKKGKCKIWAKAHNGKNSEKIIVTVK